MGEPKLDQIFINQTINSNLILVYRYLKKLPEDRYVGVDKTVVYTQSLRNRFLGIVLVYDYCCYP